MQDVLLLAYKALKSSGIVVKNIKGIYNNPRAPDKDRNIFPRLTMFEMLNNDSEYADDKAIMNDVWIRIDIWSDKNNLFELSKMVKSALEENFEMCRVELQSDMYESDTNIYHKPINVKIKMEV
ncbi:MAG: hypothetical protein ACI4A5_04425 [Hominilimicola sp.]